MVLVYNIPTCLISTIHTLIYPCYGDAWRAISQLVCTAEWVEIVYEGASLFSCQCIFTIFFFYIFLTMFCRNLVKQTYKNKNKNAISEKIMP